MKKSTIIITVLVIAALAIGAFFVLNRGKNEQTASDSPNNSDTSDFTGTDNLITYTDEGFGPTSLTVKAGATIVVENNSSEELDFSSDMHPVHNENPELNQDTIMPGESQSFSVNTPGSWGYHNHLNPGRTGTIVVEE